MKTIILSLFCIITSVSNGQTFDSFYASLANSCNQDTVYQNLIEFENLGIKELGTGALDNTYDWLHAKYTSYGYTNIEEDAFSAAGQPAKNLVITKTGSVYPDTYVIIDAHYDTKNGPGTNDNGSGTAVLLELARLLQDIETEYSIKFIHFSAEEAGLMGSVHYVNDDVIGTNMDIKIVFNLDQVGGTAGMTNDIIVCERDESPPSANDAQSAVMTDELATCIELYSSLSTEIYFAYSSDYVPFMNNGEIVTGLYEKNETPYAHTDMDSIAYMDVPYLHQVTKGSMGALAHFAIAVEEVSLSELDKSILSVYPIPSNGQITIASEKLNSQEAQISIFDISGQNLWNKTINGMSSKEQIQIEGINPGTYLLSIESEGRVYRRKIIIE